MKTQLLEDIGENHPSFPPLPTRDGRFSADRQPKPRPFPKQRIEPELQAPSSDPAPADAQKSAFDSQESDWLGPQAEDEPHWFDRWGRKALMWTSALAGAIVVAGGGFLLYNESKVERSLAVLAENSTLPARQAKASPAVPAPATAPAVGALPELKPGPAEASTQAAPPLPQTAAPALPADALVQLPPPEQKRVRSKPSVKAATAPAEPDASPAQQLAETLRQCRIAGYHAEQCLERKCSMTRYGLACRG